MQNSESNGIKVLIVDDEIGIIDSLSIFLKKFGYEFTGVTDPLDAIEKVRSEHFDLMILDFIMTPIHGDKVVEEIRKFNKELYILLLTGHKDLAPPLETIRRLDIQGYCEKGDRFDQLLLLIESGVKAINQMNTIKSINNELIETNSKLEKAYLDSIETLRYTVEAKDPYTRGHSDRVSEISYLIGKYIGINEKDLHTLKIGGLFHDVGKIGIPDSILLKPSKLTPDEYSEIKNHPSIGVHILSNAEIFKDIIPIVKHHHERYDGLGYPSKLAGEDIPYLARITAVADTFDAMTSKRVYRNALDMEFVINEFEKNRRIQFDPQIDDVFIDILKNHYSDIEKIQQKYAKKGGDNMQENKEININNEPKINVRIAKGFGISALVLSILSLLFFKYIFISVTLGLVATILGFIGLKKGDNTYSLAGLTIGIISLLITFVLFVVLNLLDTVLFYVPDWYENLR